jgi:hypothetical protein
MSDVVNQLEYLTNVIDNIYKNSEQLEKSLFTTMFKNESKIILYNYLSNEIKEINFNFINFENAIFTNGEILWFFDNKLYKLEDNSSILIQEFSSNIKELRVYKLGYRILTENNELWNNEILVLNEENIKINDFKSIFVICEDGLFYEIIDEKLVKTNKNQELVNFLVRTDNN